MGADEPAVAGGEQWPDAGELGEWERGTLPAPVPFGWKNVLQALGPGVIMLGGSIGTGEWLLGPKVTVQFGGQLLFIATLAIMFQSFLNVEVIRYALATGEPVFTGFLRTKGGPRLWSAVYLLLDIGMFFPAFAGALAQLLVAGWLGEGNGARMHEAWVPGTVMAVGITVTLITFVLTLFGGKIYNALLAAMTVKVVWVLLFMLFVNLVLVGWDVWARILRGFFFPFDGGGLMVPANLQLKDWAAIAGFAAFAGAGGLANATLSNYAREKGWGMGAHVGSIPSAIGGTQLPLSPLGCVFKPTAEAMRRWKMWWQHIYFDQYAVWAVGCFAGVILPAAMSLKVVQIPPGGSVKDWEIATMQAQGIASTFPQYGQLFWWLTLFTGFLIIWFTQLQALDHLTRRWTDILWTGSAKAREKSGGVQRIYYGLAFAYMLINIGVLVGNTLMGSNPIQIVILVAVTGGFATAISALHTFYVNRRFLPPALRPPWWREAGLLGCGVFYITMTCLAVAGRLFG